MWDPSSLPPPWGDRPSLHAHLAAHLAPGGVGLAAGGEELPDEARASPPDGLRWAPGALDGVLTHHTAPQEDDGRPQKAVDAIAEVTRSCSPGSLRRVYDAVSDDLGPQGIDRLLEELVTRSELDAGRVRILARWLATAAPDRGAVKVGVALLGLFRSDEDLRLLLTLGRHDEFTLYAAVALENALAEPEPALLELARSVEGWGRIHAVERLERTRDPRVKGWLLREGFRNSVMVEYLAHLCATAGGLREALEADAVDAALLEGAGELLRALLDGGGPARGIDDYPDGPAVTRRYLGHLRGHLPTAPLGHVLALASVRRFVEAPQADRAKREGAGWTPEVRREIGADAEALLGNTRWLELVERGLAAADAATFFGASAAAGVLGVDTWERHLQRVERGADDGSWFELARTGDPGRMARLVALAERFLPLDDIASGPATELGVGPRWRPHGTLDCVVQGLGRFPGLGWPLLRAGLGSPVTRNRLLALRALSAWDRPRWPAEAKALLEEARSREPDERVREQLGAVIEGRPLGG